MQKNRFIKGTFILILAGFIVRLLGFLYRIVLSNAIGAEGMGLFQLISPVYSLIILTLTSGISIAVSKMVAEQSIKGNEEHIKKITGCALGLITFVGISVSILVFLCHEFLVEQVLREPRTYYSFLVLIPCIPIIAVASVFKGYFYGKSEMLPTALSQIIEQIIRIASIFFTVSLLIHKGIEYACAVTTVGMALGEMGGLLVLIMVYCFRKKKKGKIEKKASISRRWILSRLVGMSLPVSLNRLITSIMLSAEYIMIPQRLVAGGMDYQQGMELYGKLTGMAMPLIFFPTIITSSIAVNLVPAISEAVSLSKYKLVNHRISKAIRISMVLGFAFFAVFFSCADSIASLVYPKVIMGDLLKLLSFLCVFIYLQQVLLGVLNGLGKQGASLKNAIVGNTIRIACVYFLLPPYGLKAYIYGVAVSATVVIILNLRVIINETGMTVDIRNWLIKPGVVFLILILLNPFIHDFIERIFVSRFMGNLLLTSVFIGMAGAWVLLFGGIDLRAVLYLKKLGKKRSSR